MNASTTFAFRNMRCCKFKIFLLHCNQVPLPNIIIVLGTFCQFISIYIYIFSFATAVLTTNRLKAAQHSMAHLWYPGHLQTFISRHIRCHISVSLSTILLGGLVSKSEQNKDLNRDSAMNLLFDILL